MVNFLKYKGQKGNSAVWKLFLNPVAFHIRWSETHILWSQLRRRRCNLTIIPLRGLCRVYYLLRRFTLTSSFAEAEEKASALRPASAPSSTELSCGEIIPSLRTQIGREAPLMISPQMADGAQEAVSCADLNPDRNRPFQGGSSINHFEKRIEFVPARKPFSGLTYSSGDFKIETLNSSGPDQNRGHGAFQAAVSNGKVKMGDGLEFFDNRLDPELSLGVSFQRIVSRLGYNSSHLIKV